MERGGISEVGLAETPVGDPVLHRSVQEVMADIQSGRHTYMSAAKDEPLNEGRWAFIEVVWQGMEDILKTEAGYDDQAYLSKKPACRHD
jgi:hypothetical protein